MASDRGAGLEVLDLSVRFGTTDAVADVDLSVERGEVVAVLGPSGCGKTTLLRAVAGLQAVRAGQVRIDGRDVTSVAVHRRGVGLMFQDYALFPHRDVRANVGFGLRMQGLAGAEVARRTTSALELVGLSDHGSRSVSSLSGGEQQRVALARALAPEPSVLLLDEPLGSLDREIRQRLLDELAGILDATDASVVYVTHDQDEAFALGDRVVIMRSGRVERDAPPERVWADPRTAFVASFLGLGALVEPAGSGDGEVRTPWGSTLAAAAPNPRLLVRPDAVAVTSEGAIPATVTARQFRAGAHLVALVTAFGMLRTAIAGQAPAVGDEVKLQIDDAGVQVVAGELDAL